MSTYLISEYLGMGREGSVFLSNSSNPPKILKFFRNPIDHLDQIVEILNSSQIDNFFHLTIIDKYTLEYAYAPLSPMSHTLDSFQKILPLILKLYNRTNLGYYDLFIARDNFMQNHSGTPYCIDYINAFKKLDTPFEVLLYKFNLINSFLHAKSSFHFNQSWINLSRTQPLRRIVVFTSLLLIMPLHFINPTLLAKTPDILILHLIKKK